MDTTEMGLLFSSIGFIALLAIIYTVLPEYNVPTLRSKIKQLESKTVSRNEKKKIIEEIKRQSSNDLKSRIITILTRNKAQQLLKDSNTSNSIRRRIKQIWPNLNNTKK